MDRSSTPTGRALLHHLYLRRISEKFKEGGLLTSYFNFRMEASLVVLFHDDPSEILVRAIPTVVVALLLKVGA